MTRARWPGQMLPRPGSIAQRLTILLAAIAALLAVLSWSMVNGFAREAAQRTQDSVLSASAVSIAEALWSEEGRIGLELPYAAFAMLEALGEDRVFYRIHSDAQTLTGYDDLVPPRLPEAAGRAELATLVFRGESVRAASVMRTVLADQNPVSVIVTVAQTRNGVMGISGALSNTAAALSVGLFVLAVVLGAVAARASLRPLNEIAQAVARRGPGDLRPMRREAPAELRPLLHALNRLMERLSTSIRRSEDFIAEAAHRVRTPLATLRTEAELALHGSASDTERASLRRMIRAVDESARSASQLLDHATVSFRADALAQDVLDAADLVARVVQALEPLAALRDITLDAQGESAMLRGDALLLESALRNVVDNALKYAPAETTVTLRQTVRDGWVSIRVQDAGPGLGGAAPEHLTRRFTRGAAAAGVIGSGLGLTIAAEALAAHGGRLDLDDGPTGGACVVLHIPCA